MPSYELVKDPDTIALFDGVMKAHHPDLDDAGVRVGLEWCWANEAKPSKGKGKRPKLRSAFPLNLHGKPAAAIASIYGYRQRVKGLPDCLVTIDGAFWKTLDGDGKVALADHELMHFDLVRDGKGFVTLDKLDRPRLTMRPHDWDLGGFDLIIQRYGLKSLDALTVIEAARECPGFKQLFLFEDDADDSEVTISIPGADPITFAKDELVRWALRTRTESEPHEYAEAS